MYIAYAFIFYLVMSFIYLKMTVYNNKLKPNILDEVTEEEIDELRGTNIYYSLKNGLFEIIGILTLCILILLHAFHETTNDNLEMSFMFIGLIFFLLSFVRSLFIINTKVRYTDKHVYITRGFSEKKYDLAKLIKIDHLSMHIGLKFEGRSWLVFIPVGVSNVEFIYKMLLNRIDRRNGNYVSKSKGDKK